MEVKPKKDEKANRRRVAINFNTQKTDEAAFLDFLEHREVRDVIRVNFVRNLFLLGVSAGKRAL